MHILAKKVLKDVVMPKVETLLSDKGITETELKHVYTMTCLAKDLLECDVMLKKLGESDPEYPKMKMDGHMPGTMNL